MLRCASVDAIPSLFPRNNKTYWCMCGFYDPLLSAPVLHLFYACVVFAVRLSAAINFNYFTTAQALQVTLESPLEKKTGSTFGPPGKAALVFFLDDLNLPEVDKYDTQSAIALVRQHIDYGHWYDRAKLTAKTIQNCQYLACMNPTAGSFEVNPRLQVSSRLYWFGPL